jgi:benzoyl-CoA reductase/2-hydroxyglutaryl-CoA dehydratase subunit BcrC/BadD/HgdB
MPFPMSIERPPKVGFFCAYTPIPLLDAAGFSPHRLLPVGDWPEEAGALLHENLCPHVKRALDRAIAGDLPELAGIVVVQSCDAMRRLEEAWQKARPEDRIGNLDLPLSADERSVAWMASELERLAATLLKWGGRPVTDEALRASMGRYAELSAELSRLTSLCVEGRLPGGWGSLQEAHNKVVSSPVGEAAAEVARCIAQAELAPAIQASGAPLFVLGNVLADPQAWALIEASGGRMVGDDVCTSGRQLMAPEPVDDGDPFTDLARGILSHNPCPRTLPASRPGEAAEAAAAAAVASGARGVVAHVMKFCDPYLARLPAMRAALEEAGLPFLVLEGDCSLRSLGQQRTRLEAFVEMLS